jgi:hypothetical protein
MRGDYFAMISQPKKAITMKRAATTIPIILKSRPAIISKSQSNISLTLTEMQIFASSGEKAPGNKGRKNGANGNYDLFKRHR